MLANGVLIVGCRPWQARPLPLPPALAPVLHAASGGGKRAGGDAAATPAGALGKKILELRRAKNKKIERGAKISIEGRGSTQ